ncbi:MAG: hypothetical protein MSH60_01945 [Ruminococcus sp.]|nr:hypothetical protein [Ruminococcus sp.]
MLNRLLALVVAFALGFSLIYIKLALIITDEDMQKRTRSYNSCTIRTEKSYASVYDCNGQLLNNTEKKYYAVVNPDGNAVVNVLPYVINKSNFLSKAVSAAPFLTEVSADCPECENVCLFTGTVRNTPEQTAVHIIGYDSDGQGVCGIEKGYNEFIRSYSSYGSITYEASALGDVLNGGDFEIHPSEEIRAGVVTTIDADIQRICEDAGKSIGKGAIVVMDVYSGEIKAMASFPDFDPTAPENYLDRTDAPFVNRALMPYCVGSIFKLVTCSAALSSGFDEEFTFNCTGSSDVSGQIFNCHKWGGHGDLSMKNAVVESCNTYFIELAGYISPEKLLDTARGFGFGNGAYLCRGIYSEKGCLPTVKQLSVPAERANFSFGQGFLTATPVQIAVMTSAIANGGNAPRPILVRGTTEDIERYIPNEKSPVYSKACSPEISAKLREFMIDTVYKENSMAVPEKVTAGGKTSTAQTGRFDEQGMELLNCWFTGFFPADCPKYAVTVLVEDGYTGNATAGPIFKEIADKIYQKILT